jgi:hypothetical protein
MIIAEENPDSFKKDEPPTRREQDGLDARYNHQFHQRLELLKRAVCVVIDGICACSVEKHLHI